MFRLPGAAFVLIFLLPYSSSFAHDWYPPSCCSGQDCRALIEAKGETVLESVKGFELWDGRIIARDKAQQSPDKQFHLCETRARKVLCFFAPPGAS